MLAGVFFVLFAVILFGAAAGVAFQLGAGVAGSAAGLAAGPAAATAPFVWWGFFPFLFFLVPFLVILVIAAMARSFVRDQRHGTGWSRHRMFEEWHRQAHEGGTGKAES